MFMSIATFCEAREQEVSFQKSLLTAVAGQGAVIFRKHGAKVQGSDKKLTEQQFLSSSSFNIVGGALKMCPKSVPSEEKSKFDSMVKEIKGKLGKP